MKQPIRSGFMGTFFAFAGIVLAAGFMGNLVPALIWLFTFCLVLVFGRPADER